MCDNKPKSNPVHGIRNGQFFVFVDINIRLMKFVILGWMHLAYAIKFTNSSALKRAVNDCIAESSVGECTGLYGGVPIGKWDVSAVTSMSGLFMLNEFFNQPLVEWDVRNVNAMDFMFYGAKSFNQILSQWDVRKVTTTNAMFEGAATFNGDISTWEVSSLQSMVWMFKDASHFNGDLSQWDVSKVTNMVEVFSGAYEFNQDISWWDTSSVTKMNQMFYGALAFNHDLSFWDISKLTSDGTKNMFAGNTVVGIQLCSVLWAGRDGDDMFSGGSKWSISPPSATCKTRTLPPPRPPSAPSPMPPVPAPAPPPPQSQKPLVAGLSVGVGVIAAFVLYYLCRRYVCRHRGGTFRKREFVLGTNASPPINI